MAVTDWQGCCDAQTRKRTELARATSLQKGRCERATMMMAMVMQGINFVNNVNGSE